MNLKESFRYQNFLDEKLNEARCFISDRSNALKITKVHCRSRVNPDAIDDIETVEPEYSNDNIVAFMCWLVRERQILTEAICKAKNTLDFCLDAAIETNKFRQAVSGAVKNMLRYNPTLKTEQGRDYKFNVEGNQTMYYYDIENSTEENYNRDFAKQVVREMTSSSDKTSTNIDSAMINTNVEYTPVFDVNESFDDIMTEFIKKVMPTLSD